MKRVNLIPKYRAWLLFLLPFVAYPLASCSKKVGTAPPSAITPTDTSAEGLADLFKRECIQQVSRVWVDDRFKNILSDTCGYKENGDCASNVDSELHWEVPTKTHSKVLISVTWTQNYNGGTPTSGPPPGPLVCGLYVPQVLAGNIKAAAESLKVNGQSPSAPREDINPRVFDDLKWDFGNDPAVIILRHHIGENTNVRDDRLINKAQYPWELIYEPKGLR